MWIALDNIHTSNTLFRKSSNQATPRHLHTHQRDNLSRTKISRKAHFTRVTEVVECCQMRWNLHRMQHICNRYATKNMICIGHFSVRNYWKVSFFLCGSTSGASDSEYIKMMLASIEIYLLDDIARQRDMSKITK